MSVTAITIRKLPDEAKRKLRLRAAANGRSMEAEARDILVTELNRPGSIDLSWVDQVIELGEALGGVDLSVADRGPARDVAW